MPFQYFPNWDWNWELPSEENVKSPTAKLWLVSVLLSSSPGVSQQEMVSGGESHSTFFDNQNSQNTLNMMPDANHALWPACLNSSHHFRHLSGEQLGS